MKSRHVPQDHPFRAALLLGTPLVVKLLEHTTDVRVPLRVVANRQKLGRRAAPEKSLDLLNRAKLRFVHVDHHPPNDQPNSRVTSFFRLQAHTSLEIRCPVQAHTSVDKAVY